MVVSRGAVACRPNDRFGAWVAGLRRAAIPACGGSPRCTLSEETNAALTTRRDRPSYRLGHCTDAVEKEPTAKVLRDPETDRPACLVGVRCVCAVSLAGPNPEPGRDRGRARPGPRRRSIRTRLGGLIRECFSLLVGNTRHTRCRIQSCVDPTSRPRAITLSLISLDRS